MQLLSKALLFLAVAWLRATHAQVSSSGATLVVGGVSYFVPGTPVAELSLAKASKAFKSSGALVPFTFVSSSSGSFSTHDLSAVITKNSASDDVWSTGFLTGMYEEGRVYSRLTHHALGVYVTSKGSPKLSPGNGTTIVLSASEAPLSASIPPGPYVVETATGKVFEGKTLSVTPYAWLTTSVQSGACTATRTRRSCTEPYPMERAVSRSFLPMSTVQRLLASPCPPVSTSLLAPKSPSLVRASP